MQGFFDASQRSPLTLMRLFGGFDGAPSTDGAGPEKRFEFDLRPKAPGANPLHADFEMWKQVAKSLGTTVNTFQCIPGVSTCICCDDASIVVLPHRIIISTSGHLMPHNAVPDVMNLLAECSVEIEWMSFLRKNYQSLWEEKVNQDTSLAIEYANLKAAFPTGRSFVFGPLDNDNYFIFIYDDVRRGPDNPEDDVQLNLAMYNIQQPPQSQPLLPYQEAGIATAHHETKGYGTQTMYASERGKYEMLRYVVNNHNSFASYETNHEKESYSDAIAKLLSDFRPERVTLYMVIDPQSSAGRRLSAEKPIGIESEHFSDYELVNRTFTTLSRGYMLMKMSIARCR
jgi:S-adenosylmethionine decarboxylase